MKNKKLAKIVRQARKKLKVYGWRRGARGSLNFRTGKAEPGRMCFIGAVDFVVGGDPAVATCAGKQISAAHSKIYGMPLINWNDNDAKNEKDALRHLKEFAKKLEAA